MKTNLLSSTLLTIFIVWMVAGCSQNTKQSGKDRNETPASSSKAKEAETDDEVAGFKLYSIKSGIIEYKHTGTRTGTSIMYFDKYGKRSASYSNLTMNKETDKSWALNLDDMQYIWKEGSAQGMKMKNQILEEFAKINDLEKFAEEIYAKMGFKPTGTETFQGKECRVFKGNMGKILIWKGILMLSEMNVMGTSTRQEATKIDINVPVKSSVFELPKGVTFSEMPNFEGNE
jgi:hypothetical protein